ncbi:TauD/TfdA dioxygenase family protein, partial [Pandoraea pneumonica]|uniref:TauD/TfdA dioxygenase family protein n=1 Tax=Pandoraea pneumonica TaxID=2508299 RepID=UPI003CEFDE10
MAERPATASSAISPDYDLDVRPLTGHIGAEIHGLDLTRPLPPEAVAAVQTALWQWKVLLFRDQPLTHEQHVAFASQFGQPTVG